MERRRYGAFCAGDYKSGWVGIGFMLLVAAVGILTGTALYLCLVPLLVAAGMLWAVVEPNREWFSISGGEITARRGRKVRTYRIPDALILVVSKAGICTDFLKNIGGGRWSYLLRNRCAVSVLQEGDTERVLRRLHENRGRAYTNTSIECDCGQVIYSFLYDSALLDALTDGRKCRVIVQASLAGRIAIEESWGEVCVDREA